MKTWSGWARMGLMDLRLHDHHRPRPRSQGRPPQELMPHRLYGAAWWDGSSRDPRGERHDAYYVGPTVQPSRSLLWTTPWLCTNKHTRCSAIYRNSAKHGRVVMAHSGTPRGLTAAIFYSCNWQYAALLGDEWLTKLDELISIEAAGGKSSLGWPIISWYIINWHVYYLPDQWQMMIKACLKWRKSVYKRYLQGSVNFLDLNCDICYLGNWSHDYSFAGWDRELASTKNLSYYSLK